MRELKTASSLCGFLIMVIIAIIAVSLAPTSYITHASLSNSMESDQGISWASSSTLPIKMDHSWTEGENMITARAEVTGAILSGNDSKIYIIGGYDSAGRTSALNQVYTVDNDSWANATPLPLPLNHAGAVAFNGHIYVVGGYMQGNNQEPSNRLFIYDPLTAKWEEGARMPTPRGALTANFVNGSLFVIGGVGTSAHPTTANEAYYPSNNTWKERAPMPTPREHLASAVVDGKLYAIGGRIIDPSANLNVTEVYDPTMDAWNSSLAEMPSKRSGLAAAASNNTIYVYGGESRENVFDTTERYDVVTDRWASDIPMPTARHGLAALASENNYDKDGEINLNIYVIGGASRPGLDEVSNSNEIYHDSSKR